MGEHTCSSLCIPMLLACLIGILQMSIDSPSHPSFPCTSMFVRPPFRREQCVRRKGEADTWTSGMWMMWWSGFKASATCSTKKVSESTRWARRAGDVLAVWRYMRTLYTSNHWPTQETLPFYRRAHVAWSTHPSLPRKLARLSDDNFCCVFDVASQKQLRFSHHPATQVDGLLLLHLMNEDWGHLGIKSPLTVRRIDVAMHEYRIRFERKQV